MNIFQRFRDWWHEESDIIKDDDMYWREVEQRRRRWENEEAERIAKAPDLTYRNMNGHK